MKFELTFEEALALLVAGQAVKLQYEIDGDELTKEPYQALKSAVEKLELQLWDRE